MADINLLKGHKLPSNLESSSNMIPKAPGKAAILVLLLLVIVELGIYGAIFVNKGNTEEEILKKEDEAAQLQTKIDSEIDEINEAVAGQFAINAFSDLLDSHNRWSRVFEELGRVTLKTVSFNSLQAVFDEEPKFLVSGTASSFSEVGKVLLGFETSAEFSEVELLTSEPEAASGLVVFEIRVHLKKDLLTNLDENSERITP